MRRRRFMQAGRPAAVAAMLHVLPAVAGCTSTALNDGAATVQAWILQNREWLFSGVLIAVPIALIGWILVNRSRSQRAEPGASNVGGDVSSSQIQSAHADEGASIQQAKNISIHHGLSLEQAENVALKTFDANFLRLAGEAADIVETRVREFTRNLFARLEEKNPEALNKARDPSYVQSVFEAQKRFATSGDTNLESNLMELLVELAQSKPRSLVEISLNQAIGISDRLTPMQLNILVLTFVLKRVPWATFYGSGDAARFAADYLEPFIVSGLELPNNYSHLMSLGCIQVGPAIPEFPVFFMTHWRTLLSTGIPREVAAQLDDGSPGYWSMFEPYDDDDDTHLRLSGQTNERITQQADSLGLSPALKRSIFQMDSKYLLKTGERINFILEVHPGFRKLWQEWKKPNAPLPRSEPTTLGVTLAHAHLSSIGKAPAPLSLWLQ